MLLPVLMLSGRAQDKQSAPPEQPKYQEPAEEDVAENPKPKVYAFNPMQAQKELTVGNFYFKQGKFHSAALRFEEATKWNPKLSDAWLRLGEAETHYIGVTWTAPAARARRRPRCSSA